MISAPQTLLRRKGKHFKGEPETRATSMFRDRKRVFLMIKDVHVVFGKGRGSQPVPNDENGHAPMWKKKTILWELLYWEALEVRNTIDVMHLTKNLCVNVLGFLGTYGQGKDTLEARCNLKEMKQREDLQPEKREKGQHYLRPASYTLSKEEKQSMFYCLNCIKVPSGTRLIYKEDFFHEEKKVHKFKVP